MKAIPLTQGKVAFVDDADYDKLIVNKWHALRIKHRFYAGRTVYYNGTKKNILMHKCIIESSIDIDHKDGNGLNNVRDNLRPCSRSQNLWNSKKRAGGKSSRFKGVSFNKSSGNWRADIRIFGKRKWLGHFSREIDAAHPST